MRLWHRQTRMRLVFARLLAVVACSVLPFVGCAGNSDGGSEPTPPKPKLVARFSYEVETEATSGTSCPATAIRLRETSSGDPVRWTWKFSDGTTSQEQNPVRTPALRIGDKVTLTVYRGSLSDSATETVNYPVC